MHIIVMINKFMSKIPPAFSILARRFYVPLNQIWCFPIFYHPLYIFFNAYTGLFYSVLFYSILRYAMPCYAMPCHAMLCHAMPCHTMPYWIIYPMCPMPCHAMPCHAMPCHAMPCHIESSTPCATYMRPLIGSALVQIMVCRLIDTKPISKPIHGYCQMEHWEQTSVMFESKYKRFHSWKCIWKCRLRNCSHFFPGEMSLSAAESLRCHWKYVGGWIKMF